MAADPPSIIDARRHQMFPTLESAEIERLRRFGDVRAFATGEPLVKVGEVGRGLSVVLSGEVEVSQRNRAGPGTQIVTHAPGGFLANWRSWPGGLPSSMRRPKSRSKRL